METQVVLEGLLGSGTMQRNDKLINNIGDKYASWLCDSTIKSYKS